MAQLLVDVDEGLLRKIEAAASKEGASVTSWVRKWLTHAVRYSWPDDFLSLYGSLADVDLERPEQLRFEDDAPREAL
jgi:hypothetical protein